MPYSLAYILETYSLETPGVQKVSYSNDGQTWTAATTLSDVLLFNSIKVNPHDFTKVYVFGSEGIQYSLNGGTSWNDAGGGYTLLGNYYKGCVASANVIYAVGGLYAKSIDGGLTFENLAIEASDLGGPGSYSYAIDFISENIGFIGVDNLLFKTIDGGASFASLNLTVSETIIGILAIDENNLLVSTSKGVYKTINGGTTFIYSLNLNLGSSSDQVTVVQKTNGDLHALLMAHNSSPYDTTLYKSVNLGLSWSVVQTYPLIQGGGSGISGEAALHYFSDTDLNLVSPTNGLYFSNDSGVSSAAVPVGFKTYAYDAVSIDIYSLVNCQDEEDIIYTLTDMSEYLGQILNVNAEPECRIVALNYGDPNPSIFTEIESIDAVFSTCDECIPYYYVLTGCEDEENIIYAEPSDELETNIDLVVQIEIEGIPTCFSVEQFHNFPENELVSVTIYQGGYADCECCLPQPVPEPVKFVRTTQAPVKQFYRILDSECDIRINSKFAENYFELYGTLHYGIQARPSAVNLDKLWIQMQLNEYSKLMIDGNCEVPITEEIVEPDCDIATIANCDLPTGISAEGSVL